MASAKQENKAEATTEEAVANRVTNGDVKLGVRRYFTIPGRDPFEEIEWETRDALIPGKDGPAFEQRGVEFPKFWSQTATNIVAQKYFRGRMTSPDREKSVKQMIGRIVDTAGGWGRADGYFADDEEARTFEDELKAILVNQLASFNSPVWFNVGFEEKPQCSACQPYHALISTPEGMVPIGEIVEFEQVGREVYDANGVTRVVAVKANGLKSVFRVTLRNGSFVEATARSPRQGRSRAAHRPCLAPCRPARARHAHAPASSSREGRATRARRRPGFADEVDVAERRRRAPWLRRRSPAGSRRTASSASTTTARIAR